MKYSIQLLIPLNLAIINLPLGIQSCLCELKIRFMYTQR